MPSGSFPNGTSNFTRAARILDYRSPDISDGCQQVSHAHLLHLFSTLPLQLASKLAPEKDSMRTRRLWRYLRGALAAGLTLSAASTAQAQTAPTTTKQQFALNRFDPAPAGD